MKTNEQHIQDFRSLESMDSDLSGMSRRHEHGAGVLNFSPTGHCNPAFGNEETDIMMTDMSAMNGTSHAGDEDKDEDERSSVASTDTYQSGASMSSEFQEDLRVNLPSHLFREIRAMPSVKGRRRGMRNVGGSARNRRPGSSRSGMDETDFMQMITDDCGEQQNMGTIRHMATSLNRKKTVLNQVQDHMKEKEQNISTFRYYRLRLAAKLQHLNKKVAEKVKENRLWSEPLKKIQGKFGTGVLSYFVFLRWLFVLNILIFLLVFLFIFIPQIIYRPSIKHANLTSFKGVDLVDGSGWLNGTELYYGHYTSDTIRITDDRGYMMPLAYLLTCASYLLLCLIIMATSMASLYNQNYLQGGVGGSVLTTKIFTAWDYSVTDREAAVIKQQSIATDMEEFLAETKEKRVLGRKAWFKLFCLRILTNILSLALIGAATYLIVEVVAGYPIEEHTTAFKELLLPLLVSMLNLLLPSMFRILASFENYEHGATAIKVSLARTAVLKLCTLAGIFVSLYKDINCSSKSVKDVRNCRIYGCWENYVGQTFYRLVWVDFAFILLATFFGEFLRRLLASHVKWWCDHVGNPGFDISRNVLDLIYAQCLCWFGTFFSPLLSFICLIKLLVIFYVKKISALNNCRPSMRPFLASKMNLLFIALLGVSYALILIALGYLLTSESRLSPSECGPFKGKESFYKVILDKIDGFPSGVRETVRIATSQIIIALMFTLLGVFIYYYKLLKSSNENIMKLLREQIVLTGKDKLYLMKRINKSRRTPEAQ